MMTPHLMRSPILAGCLGVPGCYLPAVDLWLAVEFLGRSVLDIGVLSSMQ